MVRRPDIDAAKRQAGAGWPGRDRAGEREKRKHAADGAFSAGAVSLRSEKSSVADADCFFQAMMPWFHFRVED